MLSSWTPSTWKGWLGIAILGAVIFYHRSLGAVSMLIGVGAAIYLYINDTTDLAAGA